MKPQGHKNPKYLALTSNKNNTSHREKITHSNPYTSSATNKKKIIDWNYKFSTKKWRKKLQNPISSSRIED